jgi:hypothetical protein
VRYFVETGVRNAVGRSRFPLRGRSLSLLAERAAIIVPAAIAEMMQEHAREGQGKREY